MIYHRSEDFERVWRDLGRDLAVAFGTDGEVCILTASATGAMEAVIANLFSPGDRVLVPAGGKFSRRWVAISEAYGLEAVPLALAPGKSPSAEAVAEAVRADGGILGVLLVHCETSTGALTDLESVARAVHDLEKRQGRQVLVVGDCATSFLVDELRMDAWGLDAALGASQKGLLAPPGLAFVALGARGRARCLASRSPRYYFDLRKYLNGERPPFTPAISLVQAAAASLRSLLDLGLERVWRANRASADALRMVVEAAGFTPVADHPSAGAVAFWVGRIEAEQLARRLASDHGVVVAGGHDDLKGKVLRVSGIGKGPSEIRRFARALEASLAALGARCNLADIEARLDARLEDARIWE
ncbi:MAG TPA: aminotransferase class V-fold PLP-dependent enzyme [bacterium]|nr:aminotransferase class V-fold PLP-dependent enzyme [bacterium]